jgi:cation transport regulator ChaB
VGNFKEAGNIYFDFRLVRHHISHAPEDSMEYKSNAELPPDVQEFLPECGQNIYRNSYNNQLKRKTHILAFFESCDQRLELARAAAWAAVQAEYEFKNGCWQKK